MNTADKMMLEATNISAVSTSSSSDNTSKPTTIPSSSSMKKRGETSIVPYELATWVIFGTFTLLACVDRFTWNVWPRQTYSIGSGSAGSDRLEGYKPGPWSVVTYDVLARISGRYAILCFNLLLITRMRSLEKVLGSSGFINKYIVDCRDVVNANLRLHRWNAIALCVLTFLHVWSILLPCVTHGWSAQVVPGTFEYIISERTPPGFKDADPETETMSLQMDDVFRMVEMTILLCILTPLSVQWLATRWHAGMPLHRFIMVVYFVDIVRRHSHPHSWILNTPVFCLWLLDKVYCKYQYGCFSPTIHRVKLGDDYMVLYWNHHGQVSDTLVGPDYSLRLNDSSFLEDPHIFTTFENRHKTPLLIPGKEGDKGAGGTTYQHFEWSVGTVIRVFRSKRVPKLSSKDAYSHTLRLYNANRLDLNAWGPYQGEMSSHVYHALMGSAPVILVAAGSGVGYAIDALLWWMAAKKNRQQKQNEEDVEEESPQIGGADLKILFSTRSQELFDWTQEQVLSITQDWENKKKGSSASSLRVILALTGTSAMSRKNLEVKPNADSPSHPYQGASFSTLWSPPSEAFSAADTTDRTDAVLDTSARTARDSMDGSIRTVSRSMSIPEEEVCCRADSTSIVPLTNGMMKQKEDLENGGGREGGHYNYVSSVVATVSGRHVFADEIQVGSVVFCQGSGSLKTHVEACCRSKKARFFAGLGGGV